MRSIIHLFVLMVLAYSSSIVQAQTAVPDSFPELEPITLENAARLVQLPGELTDVNEGFDVSPDGTQVAVARPDGVYLYDMGSFETPVEIIEISDAEKVYGAEFSPDGKRLAISTIGLGSEGEITQLWNLETKTLVQEFRTGWPINGGVSFSPDGRFLTGYDTLYYTCPGSCDTASTLHGWPIDNPSEPFCSVYNCHGRYGIGGFAFTPDSQTLLWSIFEFSSGDIQNANYYWFAEDIDVDGDNESTANLPAGLERHFADRTGPFAGNINTMWFSPDGVFLVARNGEDKISSLWDVETGAEIATLAQNSRIVGFLPNQAMLVVDENQHTESLVAIESGEQMVLFENRTSGSVFPANSTGQLLVSWENFETVRFYGIPTKIE